MVPVSWALASADVNAGTASAARIAIIAITTSNSISVNAVKGLLSFIFIVDFLAAVVLRVFGLRGVWFSGCSAFVPQWRGFGGQVFWGFGFRLLLDLFPGGWSENEGGLSQSSQVKSIIICNFWGYQELHSLSKDSVK